jgi:hypothetical protein
MPTADADRLGPKGHVFVEIVREQWLAPLERSGARRAMVTMALSVALIGLGTAGVVIAYTEAILLVGLGLIGMLTTLPEIRLLQAEFTEARRIGWVEPALDDGSVTVGEPAIFRVVMHARRALTLVNATLIAESRHWRGARAGETIASMPLSVPQSHGAIAAGDDWRQTVTFRIPDSAAPSFYSSDTSVRWTLTLELSFNGEAPWRRTWPMLVFPSDAG